VADFLYIEILIFIFERDIILSKTFSVSVSNALVFLSF
jgi:hypothetical protein